MAINLIPNQWKTGHLVVKDSTAADIPELIQVQEACAYMEEWSGWKYMKELAGWKQDDHPEQSSLRLLQKGSYLPMAQKNFGECSRFG